ncbi:DUF3068 domain-containing protein [Hoyosella subflava]|uniref:Hypothetical membrane protein n=1 Tax=Hoyosella subflava (strain DSM 45089 / JCM 17490 / NBRC 109087 / DQS3-9A1) TaxID=443218 RepID=F6EJD9_HOYSD|nr:DUF3068 domain-containing protein [Hoyosella subflava]AEF42555.1 Hypothetical membrane protein [Hoyosella subflava DQS3-9A1]
MTSRLGGSQRLIASVLVGLGVFLLVSAVLLPLYTIPKLKKLPLDYEAVQVSEGTGEFLDAAALLSGDGEDAVDADIPLRQQLYVTVEDPADSDVATLQGGLTLLRADTTPGRGLLSASIDRVTVDRSTALPTNDPAGSLQTDRERPAEALPRDGLQYKFPYGAGKRSYPFFDVMSRSTTEIDFVDETSIDGVTVYHYQQELEPVDLFRATRDQTNRVGLTRDVWGVSEEGDADGGEILFMNRFSTTTRDLWVEPASGVIVDSREQVTQFFGTGPDDVAVPVISYDTRYTDSTVSSMLSIAQKERDRVGLVWSVGPVSVAAPWLVGFFGLLTAGFGILMGISASRRDESAAEPGETEGETAVEDEAAADDDPAVSLYMPHEDTQHREIDDIDTTEFESSRHETP